MIIIILMEGIKEILYEMLNDIFNSHPLQAKTAFELIVKLFQNILSNPTETKFRNFNKENENIKTKVLIIPEIIDVLEVLGFRESTNDILVYEGESLDNFKITVDVLNDILSNTQGEHVIVYQYDLTNGLAKTMSPSLLGKAIEGVWHTSVCVYGKEYFYGGGIQIGIPKQTPYGIPVKELDMGFTQMDKEIFESYLKEIDSQFTMNNYDLLNHNCNHFTDTALFFLTGKNLPNNILKQHEDILSTPMGQMFKPLLESMSNGNNAMLPNMFEGNNNHNFGRYNNNNYYGGYNPY